MKKRPRQGPAAILVLTLAAAMCVPTASGAAAATATPAARTCYIRENTPHADTLGNTFTKDLYCENVPADLYGRATPSAPLTGRLKSTTSWFVCWTLGDPHPGGNNVWYYTQGDEIVQLPAVQGWGNVPANFVWTSEDPFPGLPRCPWR